MAITGVDEEEDLAKEEGQWYVKIVECRDTMLDTALNLQRLTHIANKSTMWSNVRNLSLDGKPKQLEQLTRYQILCRMLPTQMLIPTYR